MNKIAGVVFGLFLLVLINPASAQTPEFRISAGAGIGGMQYSINGGNSSLKMGYQLGAGYTYFLNERWGLGAGMELGFYQTNAELSDGKMITTNMVDSEGDGFEHRLQTKGYKEKQRLFTLNIPLTVQFQTPSHKSIQWYAKGGFKIAVPLRSSFKAHADEVQASGYYPDFNLEITDLPAHGFGKYSNWNGEGSYKLNLSASAIAETGAKFKLCPGHFIYAGVYLDYGLNNIKQDQGNPSLISYNYVKLSESKANGIFSLTDATGNVRLISYGLKIGYNL